MTDLNKTLEERAKTHGSFKDHSEISQNIKFIISSSKNYEVLASFQKEALDMIAHKMARILQGNPHEKDHWHDIAGYATLAEREIDNAEVFE